MNLVPDFLVTHEEVFKKIEQINPIQYARYRNFLQGSVSYLGPFITHGVISPKTVATVVLKKYSIADSEKLLSELCWREFFQRVWQNKDQAIFADLRFSQAGVVSDQIPTAITAAQTGIHALDQSIEDLINTGYMHNHARMWIASVAGNIAKTHWYQPAKWMHYHLLDGDLASNSLNWQWIVGAFSHKKYYANQQNLNKFSGTKQSNTFLDVDYEDFGTLEIPPVLNERSPLTLNNQFPASTTEPITDENQTVLLYSIWNLDPLWRAEESAQRVLWIDPQMHEEFPLSPKRWEFILHWAKQIPELEIFVGSSAELFPQGTDPLKIITREYPVTKHWPGTKDAREWCCPKTTGYFKNFFSYWQVAQNEIPKLKTPSLT